MTTNLSLTLVIQALEEAADRPAVDAVSAAFAKWVQATSASSPTMTELVAVLDQARVAQGVTLQYQDVAVLGYVSATQTDAGDLLPAFRRGVVWLRGRRFFSANQPLGFEADGLSLLGIAVGIFRDAGHPTQGADAGWLGELLTQSLTLMAAADPWERSLLQAARQICLRCVDGLSGPAPTWELPDVTLDLGAVLAAKGLVDIDAEQENAALREILVPEVTMVPAERAVTQLVALRWLMRQGATVLAGRATLADVVSALQQVPHALKRWPWETKPRTSGAGATSQRWDVQNEYHVQSLLWALLAPVFPDLKDEEYISSIGHKRPRLDLLIPSLRLTIEVKYLREGTQRGFANLIEEVAADTGLYLSNPSDLTQIIVFVWDDSRSNTQHVTLVEGLRRLKGVHDAVVVSRPGSWALTL